MTDDNIHMKYMLLTWGTVSSIYRRFATNLPFHFILKPFLHCKLAFKTIPTVALQYNIRTRHAMCHTDVMHVCNGNLNPILCSTGITITSPKTLSECSFYTCIVTVLRPTAVRLSSVYLHTWIFNINYGFTTLNKTSLFR
jgi:hypothetical protein